MEPWAEVAESYRTFATYAADSPTFEDWAREVADDAEVSAWISGLPRLKQQPNLVFAAARWRDGMAFRVALSHQHGASLHWTDGSDIRP